MDFNGTSSKPAFSLLTSLICHYKFTVCGVIKSDHVSLTAVDVKDINTMLNHPAHIPVFTSCFRSKSTVVDCRVCAHNHWYLSNNLSFTVYGNNAQTRQSTTLDFDRKQEVNTGMCSGWFNIVLISWSQQFANFKKRITLCRQHQFLSFLSVLTALQMYKKN